eukprot:scaffold354_cov81-Skeletonema_dohrnii-CCMP3373.AAC.3
MDQEDISLNSITYQSFTMKGVYTLGNYVPQIASSCWVAPNAAIIGNVIMEESCSVWFSATIRGDNKEAITIGPRANVQDNSVLHADAKVPLTIGKDLSEEQVQGLKESADHYVKNAGWFKAELKPMDDDEAGGFTPSKL